MTKVKLVLAGALLLPLMATAQPNAALTAKLEKLAMTMLPTNEVNAAMGFFGPVSKKYLPAFRQFGAEYETATNKLDVVMKYMPKAESALAEARKMDVPAKYAEQKEKYLAKFWSFLSAAKMALTLFRK